MLGPQVPVHIDPVAPGQRVAMVPQCALQAVVETIQIVPRRQGQIPQLVPALPAQGPVMLRVDAAGHRPITVEAGQPGGGSVHFRPVRPAVLELRFQIG